MDISQLKYKFINETETLLTSLDNTLMELQDDKENGQLIGEAFRIMHTIKGAGGMFGFEKIVELTYELETLYDLVRSNKATITNELIEISLSASDLIKALLFDEEFKNSENIEAYSAIRTNLDVLRLLNDNEQTSETVGNAKSSAINKFYLEYYILS